MGFVGIVLIGSLLLYLYVSITLMIIARKSNTRNAGLAWIPIVNLFLMCQIARRPGWWVLLLLIPVVNLFVTALLWMSIAEMRDKPLWTGALMLVPVLNLLILVYLAAGKKTAPGTSSEPRGCPRCGTLAAGTDPFCGRCGQTMPAAAIVRMPMGKMTLVASVMVVLVMGVVGGTGWLAFGSAMAYSPPQRRAPEMPQRMAGTLKEFPIDTKTSSPARPGSVITQDFQQGGTKSSSQQLPQKWLPPGLDREYLRSRANAMTSVTYRPQASASSTGSSTNTANSKGAAGSADQIYVHVLDKPSNKPGEGEEIANNIAQATRGERTGVGVNNPGGDVYAGSRIHTPQIIVFVLDKENANILIIIYAPTPATQEVAERLAANVGNGEGLNEYPEVRNSLWTLPQRPQDDLVLQEVNTLTRDDLFSREDAKSSGDSKTDQEAQKMVNAASLFIPERFTTARYSDGSQREWNALVCDFGSTRWAWNTWMFLRWTAGLGMQSTSVLGGDSLYTNTEGQGILIFQKGPYLVVLRGPSGAPQERLVGLANKFQV